MLIIGIVSGVLGTAPNNFSLAVFIGNWLSYFVGLTQHCGLRNHSRDFRKNTRSVKLNPLFSFSVLAHELAYRASHVRRRALL